MDENNVEMPKIDGLKEKAEDIMNKLRMQSMLLGGRTMAITIAKLIDTEMNKPGKRTANDLKRIIKQVRQFCQTAIDHEVEKPQFEEEENVE